MGSGVITGVQGRYAIPLLPLLFLLGSNDRFRLMTERRTAWLATMLGVESGISLLTAIG